MTTKSILINLDIIDKHILDKLIKEEMDIIINLLCVYKWLSTNNHMKNYLNSHITILLFNNDRLLTRLVKILKITIPFKLEIQIFL